MIKTILTKLTTYRTDESFGAVVDGLENGHLYDIRIIATNGSVASQPSNSMEVQPFPTPTPVLPGKTTLLSAQAVNGNQINIEFEEPTTGTKPFDFVAKVISNSKTIEVDPDAVAVQGSYFGAIKNLEKATQYSVQVYSKNSVGSGELSSSIMVTTPSDVVNDPLIGGISYQDETYKYCIFNSDATTGYEALRTKEGESTTFEVLLAGAGGGGKGQTVTLGKGGDGGGGELVIGTLPPAYAGSIFITVPSGGKAQGDSPADTTVKEGQTVLTARAGKTATDKNNGAGFPALAVPESWKKLRQFTWLEPLSWYVGGVAQAGEQNYPSGTVCGQGGAGTKDNRAGNGVYSYVAIRWKK